MVCLGPLPEGAGTATAVTGGVSLRDRNHPTTLPPPLRGTSLKEGGKAIFFMLTKSDNHNCSLYCCHCEK